MFKILCVNIACSTCQLCRHRYEELPTEKQGNISLPGMCWDGRDGGIRGRRENFKGTVEEAVWGSRFGMLDGWQMEEWGEIVYTVHLHLVNLFFFLVFCIDLSPSTTAKKVCCLLLYMRSVLIGSFSNSIIIQFGVQIMEIVGQPTQAGVSFPYTHSLVTTLCCFICCSLLSSTATEKKANHNCYRASS